MPLWCKTRVVPKAAVALGWFVRLLAILHSPAVAQGRVCADTDAEVLVGYQH